MWYFAGIEEGWPLSLSLSLFRGEKRNEHVVLDNGADLSFRSVRYFCTVIVECFSKRKEREDKR